jgi:hypothetical protein
LKESRLLFICCTTLVHSIRYQDYQVRWKIVGIPPPSQVRSDIRGAPDQTRSDQIRSDQLLQYTAVDNLHLNANDYPSQCEPTQYVSLTAVDGSLTGAAIAQRGKPGTAKLGPCISSLFWAFNASASACVRAIATISQTPRANRKDRDIDSRYCVLLLTLSDSRLHRSVASPTTSKLDHTPAQHNTSTMADASSQPKPSSSVKLVLLGEAAVGKVLHPSPSRAPHEAHRRCSPRSLCAS